MEQIKKTIFLVFSRSFVVRNILRTNVFASLKSRSDLKFVLFVPTHIPTYFKEEFNDSRITFEEIPEIELGKLRNRFFEPMLSGLVYTDSSKFFARYGGRVGRVIKRNYLAFLITHCWSICMSRFRIVKKLFRYLDRVFFPDTHYDTYFKKYNPALVVVTTVMSKRDRIMLKAARRFGVPSIGLTRGWDNLDRLFLPCVPDTLIVQNEVMKEHAIEFHDVPAERIIVTGFPQFDMYVNEDIYENREVFLKKMGFEPERSVIFYGGEGEWAPHDEHIVALIAKWIKNGELVKPCSLIVRPHWSDVTMHRYDTFKDKPHIFVDEDFRITPFFTDKWDPDMKEMTRLANEFRHCALLITYVSTLAIEGALFDKPVINVDFYADTEPDQGPYFGRWYKAKHYQSIIETGGVSLAQSEHELKIMINDALEHPEHNRENRLLLAKKMAFNLDGRAGEHMADAILTILDTRDSV